MPENKNQTTTMKWILFWVLVVLIRRHKKIRRIITLLAQPAFSFGTAVILVITLMRFYTKMGSERSANLALLGGLIICSLCKYIFNLEAPYLASILAAVILFLLGTWGALKALSAINQ